jgi:hypothetical protein
LKHVFDFFKFFSRGIFEVVARLLSLHSSRGSTTLKIIALIKPGCGQARRCDYWHVAESALVLAKRRAKRRKS